MRQLNIDTGVEEFCVNGRGVLRFNPGDPNIYHRFFAAREELAALDEELVRRSAELPGEGRDGESLALLAEYDRRVKDLLNRVDRSELSVSKYCLARRLTLGYVG